MNIAIIGLSLCGLSAIKLYPLFLLKKLINLAARILAQLEEFDSGVVFIPKPATLGNATRKSPISRTVNSNKQAAIRTSIKLDAGVKCAIRVLASDDAFVIPDALSYNSLLSKHLAQPSDRRQLPPIIQTPICAQFLNYFLLLSLSVQALPLVGMGCFFSTSRTWSKWTMTTSSL